MRPSPHTSTRALQPSFGSFLFGVLGIVQITLQPSAADAQNAAPTPEMTAVRIEGDIPLTGRLDDPRWKLAQVVEAPFEIQPGENTRARQRTFIRILYNQETLYFGFDCRDSHPEQIRAHVTDRDNIFDDDYALAIFDTYGDKQRAYELFVNPNGVQGDILRTGENEDSNFDMVWKSAAARSDSGYTVVMAIPFKSIRFPSRREQRWVMMLGRNYPRESRAIFSWTPNDRNNPCLVCQGGILTGIRDVEGTGSVELLPYAAAVQSGSLNDAGDPHSGYQNGNVQGRVGGGIRYAPTPDFAADAVVNPDFSQVESDADQVSVNTT
ncbi:MAG TPA: carbohydrate binding family 9 domain-containing protein, partial [Bacteroidota bacterium]|nr:carbohydrate binding family 9 domain-containing protein [Bacteroidota bacterium]